MRKMFGFLGVIALLAAGFVACDLRPQISLPAPLDQTVFNIPHVNTADPAWMSHAFRIAALSEPSGRTAPSFVEGRNSARLAWDDTGLLVAVDADDRTPVEAEGALSLGRGDSVEIFVASAADLKQRFQLIIAPGNDPRFGGQPRWYFNDSRADKTSPKELHAQITSHTTAHGYQILAHIPFDNLQIKPAAGAELRVQIAVRDLTPRGAYVTTWYPSVDSWRRAEGTAHRVVLAQQASLPDLVTAGGLDCRIPRVLINADPSLVGQKVEIHDGARTVAQGKLDFADLGHDRVTARISLPSRIDQMSAFPYGELSVFVAGTLQTSLKLLPAAYPDEALDEAALNCGDCIFDRNTLPKFDFRYPEDAASILGPYSITTTYYDAELNPVTTADKPGRYGAITEIRAQNYPGSYFRYTTLYRLSHVGHDEQMIGYLWRELDLKVYAANSDYITKAAGNANQYWRESSRYAALFAGLHELKPDDGKVLWRIGPDSKNSEWWYALKKKLGGGEYQYATQLPPGYDQDPQKKWPTILFLHGSGERGADLNKLYTQGLTKYVKNHPDFPFIVISPQCPLREEWTMSQLSDLLDEVQKKYHVDADRIYLTGLSMGGYGTWRMAIAYPDRFAAAAPICGQGDPAEVARLSELPLWSFHGDHDDAVPIQGDIDAVNALRAKSGRVKFTIYPGVGHDSWTQTYLNPELYSWFLQQKRGAPAEPKVAPK